MSVNDNSNNELRQLPAVGELLQAPGLQAMVERLPRDLVLQGVRGVLDEVRQACRGTAERIVPGVAELVERIQRRVLEADRPVLRGVINATGILLHTGLGRAPLAEPAVEAVAEVARGYCNVELQLDGGTRGNRHDIVRRLLCELTGAEDALVVNNNAGATVVVLAALAAGRGVIVSRGELVEIGGSFRLPEIMGVSGARLIEVGTTNKTRLEDYASAIDETTAAVMRVHTSNYRIVGFTESVPLDELIALGRRRGLKVIDDIGSGALADFRRYGIRDEPMARESIAAGVDVALFSGDKLLGGPQAGLIVGRRETVSLIERHPLMRALRVDKLTLAALQATLRLYRDPEQAIRDVPLLALLSATPESLRKRADALAGELRGTGDFCEVGVIEDVAYLGGGAVPAREIVTWCVSLLPNDEKLDEFAARLRNAQPAVVARIHAGRLLLDLRSVFPREDVQILQAVKAAAIARSPRQ